MKRINVYLVLTLFIAGLARADQTIQSAQQALKNQGFYYGNITGEKNADTTAAIRRYQIRKGLQVTGDLNPETIRSLNLGSNLASRPQATPKPAITPPDNVRPADSPAFSQNPMAPSLGDRETNPVPAGAAFRWMPPRARGRFFVATVQDRLMSRGYYQGQIDGSYGRRTAFAVRVFQVESGFPPTGRLDATTLDALGLSDANLAYLKPVPRQEERWVPVMKFKHGQWKVKWKKYH